MTQTYQDYIKIVSENEALVARLESTDFELYRVYRETVGNYHILMQRSRTGLPKPFDVVPTENREKDHVNKEISAKLLSRMNDWKRDENIRRGLTS